VQPQYPDDARQPEFKDRLFSKAEIDKNEASRISFCFGASFACPSRHRAVKQWKYKPYLLNGQPVGVETQITVAFQLSGH